MPRAKESPPPTRMQRKPDRCSQKLHEYLPFFDECGANFDELTVVRSAGTPLGPPWANPITMSPRSFVRTLEVKLDEAFFVFRQLPKQLQSASKRLGLHTLRDQMLARARELQARADKLMSALRKWGDRKPYPCDCADLATELNDLRHAVKKPAPDRWLYSKAVQITTKLSAMVRERLLKARRLAILLGEFVLAADIKELLEEERRAQAQLKVAGRNSDPENG